MEANSSTKNKLIRRRLIQQSEKIMKNIEEKKYINPNVIEEQELTINDISRNLLEITKEKKSEKKYSVPISELSLLGASVASLVPALRTVTSTYGGGEELYTIVNKGIGDTLQLAKDGNSWASLKTTEGSKKMVKLSKVNPTTKSITPVDPTTMMMAVALYSIEQQLARIESMQKEILSFLEAENESEIEADVETLTSIISKYKHNWDNDKFMSSNHKQCWIFKELLERILIFIKRKYPQSLKKIRNFSFNIMSKVV